MQGTTLNRAAIEEANKIDLSARAITNETNEGLWASLGYIARYGLLVVTVWLLPTSPRGVSQGSSPAINLLSPKNGGQIVVATNDGWLKTIDGNESHEGLFQVDDSAVYAFKDERPATFDTFAVMIPGKGDNL